MSNQIVDFRLQLNGEKSAPAADKLLAGNPHTAGPQLFQRRQPAISQRRVVEYPWQVAHPLFGVGVLCPDQGRVALENLTGERWEFSAGDGFVVPAGFAGTWEVIDDCTKFYAIFEART